MSMIWSKFVHNCAINAVSAITGLRPGEIARNPSAAWIMEALLDEILAVLDRAGVDLPEHDSRAEIYDHAWGVTASLHAAAQRSRTRGSMR